jgi:hypothetical protein
MMMLVDGDLVQLAELRKLNVEQYLILLERKMKEKKKDNGAR